MVALTVFSEATDCERQRPAHLVSNWRREESSPLGQEFLPLGSLVENPVFLKPTEYRFGPEKLKQKT